MREEYYWDEIQGIGKLYTDIELVVGFEPVLFVCTVEDDVNNKYLVMTYDSYGGVYILRKINNKELLDMLENRVTMEETFRNGTSILKTYIDDSDNMQYEMFVPTEFDGCFLPRKNEFLELKSRHILSYIERIKKEEKSKAYVSYRSDLKRILVVYMLNEICDTGSSASRVITISNSPKNGIQWGLSNPGYVVGSFTLSKNECVVSNLSKMNFENYNMNNLVLGRECLIDV